MVMVLAPKKKAPAPKSKKEAPATAPKQADKQPAKSATV